MRVVEIDEILTKWEWGSKTKIFFLVAITQPSIIKQFERISTSLKLLKVCPSAKVWFAESC